MHGVDVPFAAERDDSSNKPLRVATESFTTSLPTMLARYKSDRRPQRHVETLAIVQQAAVQKDGDVFANAALLVEHVRLQRRLLFKGRGKQRLQR